MSLAPARTLAFLLVACLLAPGCASMGKQLVSSKEKDENLLSQLSLARLTERHGGPEQARQIYRAILNENPENQTAYHRLAVLDAAGGDPKGAEQNFEKALTCGEPTADLLRDYGYMLYLQRRLEEAERLTRDSLARNPRNNAAHNNLGLILAEQGRFDEALAEFRQGGGEAEAHANMGYAYTLVEDFGSAEKHYHRALEIDKTLKPAAEGLMQLAELRDQRMRAARVEIAKRNASNQTESIVSTEAKRLEAAMISSIQERPLPVQQSNRPEPHTVSANRAVTHHEQIPASQPQHPSTSPNPNVANLAPPQNPGVAHPEAPTMPNAHQPRPNPPVAPVAGPAGPRARVADARSRTGEPHGPSGQVTFPSQPTMPQPRSLAPNSGSFPVNQAVSQGPDSATMTSPVNNALWSQTAPWQAPTWTPPSSPAGAAAAGPSGP